VSAPDRNTVSDTGVALVTGAAGGVGHAAARLLAERGSALLLTDIAEAPLASAYAALGTPPGSVATAVCDVSDATSVDALAERLASGPPIHTLIHAAGLSPTMAGWREIIDVDLVGTARILEAALPSMAAGGAAVCIASMAGYIIPENPDVSALLANPLAPGVLDRLATLEGVEWGPELAYGHAKRAVRALVARGATRWAGRDARLVSISPGSLDTAMGASELAGQPAMGVILKRTPIARLGRPEEIAALAVFLASPAASYVTGIDVLADGGAVAALGLLG
jgi:NAD(P)-dependent dehydrogenase (short-subunit alcohol dehydrogenase family)